MSVLAPQFSLIFLIGVAVAAFFLGRSAAGNPRSRLEQADQEKRQSDALRLAYGKLPGEKRRAIEQLLRDGRLIEAIRDLRLLLGCGLKEAKDLAESLRDRPA